MSIDGIEVFEKFLDFSTQKQKLISKNIANISTVNYQREDISFDNFIQEANNELLKTTNESQFQIGISGLPNGNKEGGIKDTNPEMESFFNNVDIDKEMADLARNNIMFKFASRKVGNYYKSLQNIISRGR